MGAGLQSEMPEIKSVVRVSKASTNLFEINTKKFEGKNALFVESNFQKVFSFKLFEGDAGTALQGPDGILLTEKIAKKYFANENPVGKIIRKMTKERFIKLQRITINTFSLTTSFFNMLPKLKIINISNRVFSFFYPWLVLSCHNQNKNSNTNDQMCFSY